MNKKITIKSRFGAPIISTTGYDGDSCLTATDRLEKVLSGEGGMEIRVFEPGVGTEEQEKEVN